METKLRILSKDKNSGCPSFQKMLLNLNVFIVEIKQMDQTQVLPLSIVFSKIKINIILNTEHLYKYTYITSINQGQGRI